MQETATGTVTNTTLPSVADTTNLPALANAFTDDKKVNIAKFSEQQRQRMLQVVQTTGQLTSTSVDNFSVEPQKRANAFLDELLKGYKTYDTGKAGELTLQLARKIDDLNLPAMKKEAEGGNWLVKIPLIGHKLSALNNLRLAHQDITKFLDEIEQKAQREFGNLANINNKLDRLVESTEQNVVDLEIYLAAGQVILMRERADFAAKRDEILQSNDPIQLMKLRDKAEIINAFETRLLKLAIAFNDALLSIPQIRLTQEAARITGRDIRDTILYDLPNLKRAIIRVASLQQITAASKNNEARRQLALKMREIGDQALDEAYTMAKQSQGKGVEEVAALAASADKLIETINKGVRLDEENRLKRDEAQRQLVQVQDKLMDGLRSNAIQVANAIG